MNESKLTGEFYEDVKILDTKIQELLGICECIEKECIINDGGKTASESFIYINELRTQASTMTETSKRLMRSSDIERFGGLSKYVRDYLA